MDIRLYGSTQIVAYRDLDIIFNMELFDFPICKEEKLWPLLAMFVFMKFVLMKML